MKLVISGWPTKLFWMVEKAGCAAKLAERVPGIVQITCDAWAPYVPTLRTHLLGRLNLAVMQKIYGKPENTLEKVDPNHRYSQPKCTGIRLKTCAGDPDVDKICTSHVERLNLSVRTFNRRFTRLCPGWSRKLANHRYSVALFVVAYNFCKRHETLDCTPALGARLTDHNWTIEELVKKTFRNNLTTMTDFCLRLPSSLRAAVASATIQHGRP